MCSAKKVFWKFQVKFLKSILIELISGKLVMSLAASKILFFDSAKKASSDVTTFLNMRLSLHRNQLFEKLLHVNELPSQEGFIEDYV